MKYVLDASVAVAALRRNEPGLFFERHSHRAGS
jgi:hypothetical protein